MGQSSRTIWYLDGRKQFWFGLGRALSLLWERPTTRGNKVRAPLSSTQGGRLHWERPDSEGYNKVSAPLAWPWEGTYIGNAPIPRGNKVSAPLSSALGGHLLWERPHSEAVNLTLQEEQHQANTQRGVRARRVGMKLKILGMILSTLKFVVVVVVITSSFA